MEVIGIWGLMFVLGGETGARFFGEVSGMVLQVPPAGYQTDPAIPVVQQQQFELSLFFFYFQM